MLLLSSAACDHVEFDIVVDINVVFRNQNQTTLYFDYKFWFVMA